jgi:hypothetical protein
VPDRWHSAKCIFKFKKSLLSARSRALGKEHILSKCLGPCLHYLLPPPPSNRRPCPLPTLRPCRRAQSRTPPPALASALARALPPLPSRARRSHALDRASGSPRSLAHATPARPRHRLPSTSSPATAIPFHRSPASANAPPPTKVKTLHNR